MSVQLLLFGFSQNVAEIAECERTPNASHLGGINPRAVLLIALGESVMEFLPGCAFFDAGAHTLRCKIDDASAAASG